MKRTLMLLILLVSATCIVAAPYPSATPKPGISVPFGTPIYDNADGITKLNTYFNKEMTRIADVYYGPVGFNFTIKANAKQRINTGRQGNRAYIELKAPFTLEGPVLRSDGKIKYYTERYQVLVKDAKKPQKIRFTFGPKVHIGCNGNACGFGILYHDFNENSGDYDVKAGLVKDKLGFNQENWYCLDSSDESGDEKPGTCVSVQLQKSGNQYALSVNGQQLAIATAALSETLASAFKTAQGQIATGKSPTGSG